MNKSIEITMLGQQSKELRCDAVKNRQRILDSAETLFATHGVEQVTMAMIAKAAKVGKGTLYRNFANKAVLALVLVDSQMREFQENMLVYLRRMSADNVPHLEQLAYFIADLLVFSETNAPLLCAVNQGNILPNDDLQRPHLWQARIAAGLLERAVMVGEISAETNTQLLADLLLSPVWAPTLTFLRTQRDYTIEQIANGINQLIQGLANS